jgi:endoglucanase
MSMDISKNIPGVLLPALLILSLSLTAQETDRIRFNQVGFQPGMPKTAVVTGSIQEERFYVLASGGSDTVFRGKLTGERRSGYSSTVTRMAHFSGLKKEGRYLLYVPGVGRSKEFLVSRDAYADVAKAVLKGFYYQRSDQPLEAQHAGKWSRPSGHPDTAVLVHPSAATALRPAGTKLSSPGGWYDAGDYNKYIVNSGITMGTLFSAYEDFPGYFIAQKLNIPESNDAVPDILNETIYNLRWMLTMQDPADGGVYHKCTNAVFDGMVMPGVTKDPRYLVQKSTPAALHFAAVTAQAARVLKPFNRQLPGLADSCLAASQRAWEWAIKNPELRYSQRAMNEKFDPDVQTGEYSAWPVQDEWLWAAAELYATTGGQKYYNVLRQRMSDKAQLPSWGNVATMGYLTLCRLQKTLPATAHPMVRRMKDSITRMADRFLSRLSSNAFNTVMGQSKSDFEWGSNAVAANQGMVLVYAYRITKNKAYLEGALSNLDYLLGRNATGYCFVTGFGNLSPMHPHHRPSEADGIAEPIPGLLVGGPNPGMQDKCRYPFTEPETAYSDVACSYASNEIAINWNAAAVYLFSALDALGR